ncbi:hypothetical protein HAX54_004935 [Datura stramonium]|uniref:Uncharacterized protein n=1 Tax=Datura stramonium TaxID=4076 RepID=A0ABS8T920_DATST|nr:hypothetical protein [Datura stramonium]
MHKACDTIHSGILPLKVDELQLKNKEMSIVEEEPKNDEEEPKNDGDEWTRCYTYFMVQIQAQEERYWASKKSREDLSFGCSHGGPKESQRRIFVPNKRADFAC